MTNSNLSKAIERRRTFAIISHPDAGKTTITEKLLLLGSAINQAGTVKSKKSDRHVMSDWMAMEQERGISVTTSVMQFPYADRVVNLLDTPGHEDFSEDTYRTLTAVDSALMVIDGAKGVEPRTIKLMEVCRLRDTPIITFINKLDREIRDPVEILDEIEEVLQVACSPINWPIGWGRDFKGIYDLMNDVVVCYEQGHGAHRYDYPIISGLSSHEAKIFIGDSYDSVVEQIDLVRGATHEFSVVDFRAGILTPVYFGTALGNFGVKEMLDGFTSHAPAPQARDTDKRSVIPSNEKFSGFVFKIQANMDPKHRDRIAFLRICSGSYRPGMRLHHVRLDKDIKVSDALTFLAGDRSQTEDGYPGDIIGLHNHGTIQIGDTFTEGDVERFKGIPNFAPELFRKVRVKDPLKTKQLEKGILQLSEEGASQVFRPMRNNDIIVGAVGSLQFDLVAYRLKEEYRADCIYENVQIFSVRWVHCDDETILSEFRNRNADNLSIDGGGHLAYLAPNRANLRLMKDRWPRITFANTREH